MGVVRTWRPHLVVRWAYRAGQTLGRRIIFPSLFRVRIEGENHWPSTGPCIVASNHFSNFDPILLGAYLPRQITFLAKRELVDAPLLGVIYRLWGVLPVNRDGLDLSAVRQLIRALQGGNLVGMYPEGTRSRDAVLHRPKAGVAYIALKLGTLVVPVSIWGPEAFSWRRRLRDGRIPVTLRFGPPLEWERQRGPISDAVLEDAGHSIMRAIAAGLPHRFRGTYA
jgi:1-acyl-sn-glycerol-3-phosphate acyltransferase